MTGWLFFAATLVSGVPDSVFLDICFGATDGAPGYDEDGPIFHQMEFDQLVVKHRLTAAQTRVVERECKDHVTRMRFIVLLSRKYRLEGSDKE